MRSWLWMLLFTLITTPVLASGGEAEIPDHPFSFEGHFGSFDRAAQQRGLQVFQSVCMSCHALSYIRFRDLGDLGFSEGEIKALAAQYTIQVLNDAGENVEVSRKPSDAFPSPYPNELAARAGNNGAYPPDLSLITKARPHGPDYLYALLTGYGEPPAGFELQEGMYYNKYFPGHQIAMPPPLSEGVVEYSDGTQATVPQMAEDLTTFLAWAAEPEMEVRKRLGVQVIVFLTVLAGLFYASKRRVWASLKKKPLD